MPVQNSLGLVPERSIPLRGLMSAQMEEKDMTKLGYVLAAMGAIAVAAPSLANAETVVIKHRDHMHRDMHRGWHHAWHRDNGWHRGWRHHDKMVIVKHRREG